jgi:choline dehydrogenase-like flavoprotein
MRSTPFDNIVIGSGPTGVACAMALLDRGESVTMIDVGATIEPARAAAVERLRGRATGEWLAGDLAMIKGPTLQAAETVKLKLAFGSDFVYGAARSVIDDVTDLSAIGVRPTFAKGGFSNVWGGSVLSYLQADIDDWPIGIADLAPHYGAVGEIIGISGRHDALARLFPLYANGSVPASAQAADILRRADGFEPELRARGVVLGRSRVAIGAGCVCCRMCMYGCPYGQIFNAAAVVERMARERPSFDYRGGLRVTRFFDSEKGAGVDAVAVESDSPVRLAGKRVFVAAGVLSTALLTLHSLRHSGAVVLRDSQYFLLPLLMRQAPRRDPAAEPQHTLAQMFLEMRDRRIGPNSVHLQLYTYNEIVAAEIARKLRIASRRLSSVVAWLSARLVVAQGYLHSHQSSALSLRLASTAGSARLAIETAANDAVPRHVRAVSRKLWAIARYTGLYPAPAMRHLGEPGRGYHCGGTFPMMRIPAALGTTTLGQVAGMKRVHIVDASVLPSVPASTITLTAMANAHRIGTMAGR